MEGYSYSILMPDQQHNTTAYTQEINDLSLANKHKLIASIKDKKLAIRLV